MSNFGFTKEELLNRIHDTISEQKTFDRYQVDEQQLEILNSLIDIFAEIISKNNERLEKDLIDAMS